MIILLDYDMDWNIECFALNGYMACNKFCGYEMFYSNHVIWFLHVWHMTIIKYVCLGFDSLFIIKWFWYEMMQGEVFLQLYVVDRQNDAESRDSVAH